MNILVELTIRNVFSQPNPSVTKNSSGLPPGKTSGICYNYYLNDTYKNDPLIHAFLRKKVAKDISLSESQNFSDRFESKTIPKIMASRALSWRDDRSLYDVIKKEEVQFLEEMFLLLKEDFKKEKHYIFPLQKFSGKEFRGKNFSILSTDSIDKELSRGFYDTPYYSKVNRWLKIYARSTERACERMEAVCGSFSLTLNNNERHQFSMASAVSGHIDEETCFHSLPSRVLPSLSTSVEIDDSDASWLKEIDKKLSDERSSSKELQALRFFFFSWFAVSQERFALNCMALDALVPRKFNRMQDKCEWIRKSCSVDVDLNAIELLFKKIRSSIIHGSSASLPLCIDYPTFVSLYRVEALSALDALTADVLKSHIFSSAMGTRISPLDRDPEIKSIAEKIFGADNLSHITLRSGPLRLLSKGHPSSWEGKKKPSNLLKKFLSLFNSRTA